MTVWFEAITSKTLSAPAQIRVGFEFDSPAKTLSATARNA
jgi:hypothetical protein